MAKETTTGAKPKIIKVELSEAELGNKELAKGRVTEYEVPKGEEGAVHVELERTSFDRFGVKKSVPTVQKMDERAWLNFRKQADNLGYNHVRVLFAPAKIKGDLLETVKRPQRTTAQQAALKQ